MKEYFFSIEGMSCASCVASVERALTQLEGVKEADINLAMGEARVVSENVDQEKLIHAVKQAGYDASLIRMDGNGRTENKEASDEQTGDAAVNGEKNRPVSHDATFKKRFWVALPLAAIVFVMDMGPMVIGVWHDLVMEHLFVWTVIQMLLTAVVLFYAGSSFFIGAMRSLRRRSADMNTLVAIGTGAAFTFSMYALFFGKRGGIVEPQEVYFETAAIIIALILLGKWMEERARHKGRDAITGLLEMTPQKAHRLKQQGNCCKSGSHEVSESQNWETVPVKEIKPGDIMLVKTREQIPVDGIVVSGTPAVDESMMTGESIPVDKKVGSDVIGGTRNSTVSFQMEASKVGADTVLAHIIRTVKKAQSSKPPIQRLVDNVAAVFVPIVLVVAAITFVVWWTVGYPAQAMIYMVAVLVIACPCALGLATPMGLMVSSGRAAEKGILIKDAVTLEQARRINMVLFDKTGTLTTGQMGVTRLVVLDHEDTDGNQPRFSEEDILRYAASVEKHSEHPIAKAIEAYASNKSITTESANQVETVAGSGIAGQVGKLHVQVNALTPDNQPAFSKENLSLAEDARNRGETVVVVSINTVPVGLIMLADQIRPEAAGVIRELKERGIATGMLTGDHPLNAEVVARHIGLDEFEAQVMPDQKVDIVRSYQMKGKRVAFVGDGINDAAALVQADLGMALSGGTDLAISSSDITLVGGSLEKVTDSLLLSYGTLRIIRQNLFWAFAYNTIGIPLAAVGFLSPMVAAFAMGLSSVSVVMNSLRIKKL